MTGLADAMRAVSVLLYACILMAATWTVLLYFEAYKRQRDSWKGLLPHHVWVIGTSYILYGAGTIVWAVSRIGERPSFALALSLGAGLSGAYGMWLILQFERGRKG